MTKRFKYLHNLPTDCVCIIFTWLQPYEAILLSRTSRWWYEISSKKQAYQPLPLPSFDKDDFDLLAYERWKNEQRDPFIWTPKELVQCSTSRVMQHQQDLVLIFNSCSEGRFHGLPGVSESEFHAGLKRFHSVRCLQIQFDEHSCRCPAQEEDFLLPSRTLALIIPVIRTWSSLLVSIQIDIPVYASQIFDALEEQSDSIPHLQHVIIPSEQIDAYAVLLHGFHTSSIPAGSLLSQPSTPFVPSHKFGGVLELLDQGHSRLYPPDADRRRRDEHFPFTTDPDFIRRKLSKPPFHLIIDEARHGWCHGLAPELTRIHTISQRANGAEFLQAAQDDWNRELDGLAAAGAKLQRFHYCGAVKPGQLDQVNIFDASHLIQLSVTFKSLVYHIPPSSRDAAKQYTDELKRLIPTYIAGEHKKRQQLAAADSDVSSPSIEVHPFASLQSLTFQLPSNPPHLQHEDIAINDWNVFFPALNELHLSYPLRIEVWPDLSTCTWLRHLSIGVTSKSTTPDLGDPLYVRLLLLGLPRLESLSLTTDFSPTLDRPSRFLHHVIDALVLANPHLCEVTLDGHLSNDHWYRYFRCAADIGEFQSFLIYLHLLWQKLVPSHPLPPIPRLHPVTRSELLPLHLPFCSRGHRQLNQLAEDHDRKYTDWIDRRLVTRVSQGVKKWFNRFTSSVRDVPSQDELRLEAAAVEVREYLERETHDLNLRIQMHLEFAGRLNIPARKSYFRMRLFGGDCVF